MFGPSTDGHIKQLGHKQYHRLKVNYSVVCAMKIITYSRSQ